MAKRYIIVRVVDSSGKPTYYAKVVLYVSGQTGVASGPLPEKYTNAEGIVEFDVDLDQFAQIAISVNGKQKISSSPIRSEYRVTA